MTGSMILVDAMKRADSTDPKKIRDEIEKTKGFVGTGGIVNMSPTDHLGLDLSAFRMLEIKGGDWTLIVAEKLSCRAAAPASSEAGAAAPGGVPCAG